MTTPSPDAESPAAPMLLIVDDDRAIRELLGRSLAAHGYRILIAANVREMQDHLSRTNVDLILLDIMMPGEDGLSAASRLAHRGGPPIVLLSALGEEQDRIAGLEAGAGHYLPKPCSAREVLATVRAALRQRGGLEPAERRAFGFGDGWRIDFTSHELTDPDGVLVDLTDGEFAVLRAFVERPRRVLPREMLLEAARGPDTASFDRAIDVQVSRLRRKLKANESDIIRTIRNEGYMFVPQVLPA